MKFNTKLLILIDLAIITITYYALHFFKFNFFTANGIYLSLYIFFATFWLLYSLYYEKYKKFELADILTISKSIIWSSSITLFSLVVIVTISPLISISRLFILQLVLIPTIFEILLYWIIIKVFNIKSEFGNESVNNNDDNFRVTNTKMRWVMVGGSMLLIIYFILIKIKTGNFFLYPWSERILLIIYGSWLFTIFLTKKYSKPTNFSNIFYLINPYLKSGLIMLTIATFIYFFFRIESISRFLLFGTIITFTTLESIYVLLYYYIQKSSNDKLDNDNISASKKYPAWNLEEDIFKQELSKYNSKESLSISSIFDQISFLEDKNDLVHFLESNLKNVIINFFSSSIFSTRSIENIEILKNKSKNVIINLHKLNDFKTINQYLITCHEKLVTDGLLIGHVLPIDTSFKRITNKMPKLVFNIYYPIYFLFNRLLPKIPKVDKLYSLITNGMNRPLSKSEMFGRLNYCGFKIENEIIINSKLYFIAKKVRTVSSVQHPSYHMIVKLNRVGLNGKDIYIYKFRTMYPYSEFLQEYIYEKYDLTNTGNKFKNDFRITNWGKFLRTFWLDELPQLFNWLRGDLNLIGVRALSKQYLSLYPKSHQDYRIKFKPGLIPPFYVDLPVSLEDKISSEINYLNHKEKSPLKTDIKYGFKAIYNILIKGARSS